MSGAQTDSGFAEWCVDRLQAHREAAQADPHENPVAALAYELFAGLEAGALRQDEVRCAAKAFGDNALADRALALRDAHDGRAAPGAMVTGEDFTAFRARAERTRVGVVFTAHPTFALGRAQLAAIGEFASGGIERDDFLARLAGELHAPDEPLTLVYEHEAVSDCLRRARRAIDGFNRRLFEEARTRFPGEWTAMTPAPVSLATWVGYDIDGRTDIHWTETFRIRLAEKAAQLREYARGLEVIADSAPAKAALTRRLDAASALAAAQAAAFEGDMDDPGAVINAGNLLSEDHIDRLTSLAGPIETLESLIVGAPDDNVRIDYCVLRTAMRNYGLGAGRIHLRVNAAQVRSALRADLGIGDEREFGDRTTFDDIARRAAEASRKRVNAASIFLEQMTARRQLMICAQFLKHIDADAPIRFLIAECEAPATIMGAVYLARHYGVDHAIDISPLFETPDALERGGRFMERLLSDGEYVRYVRQRKRLSIQIGFSDSGRFMGQMAANLGIERLQILLARAMARAGVSDIEALIFNTHGESMGRGGYPGNLKERFDYLMTPWARAKFAREGIATNIEASFQGGDGFLHFETQSLADSTIHALLAWGFGEPQADHADSFYTDINYSWDFYRSVKGWQETLFENADYHAMITAFAPNLLFTTGSRKTRRQSGAATTGPRSLRAIPHNAILQQLAAPANVFGGVGLAAASEPDRLADHYRQSPRMRQAVGIVAAARARSNIEALRAYGSLFDAAFWNSLAAQAEQERTAFDYDAISAMLAEARTREAIDRISVVFGRDLIRFDRVFADETGVCADGASVEPGLLALHAIRIALIMRAFVIVARLPSFSSRHDVTRGSLFDLVFALRLEELAELLERIFPAVGPAGDAFAGLAEPGDDDPTLSRGYPEIHESAIAPLRAIHDDIRHIGVAISHFYGAYG